MRHLKAWLLALTLAASACAGDPRYGRYEGYAFSYGYNAYFSTYYQMVGQPGNAAAQSAFANMSLAYGNFYYCWFPWWTQWLDGSMEQSYWLGRWQLGTYYAQAAYDQALASYQANPTAAAYQSLVNVQYAHYCAQLALNQGAPSDGLAADLRLMRNALNADRQAAGLGRLVVNGLLNDASAGHAVWMTTNGSAAHVESNGSTPASRATAKGYVGRVVESDLLYAGNYSVAYSALLADSQEFAALRHPLWTEFGLARNGSQLCVTYGGPSAASTRMQYNGGPVMGKVKVVPVYFGSYWNTAAGQSRVAALDGSYQTIVASSYADLLLEYSTPTTTIGRGTVASHYISGTATPAAAMTAEALEALLQAALPALPAPDENTLYMLCLPPGTARFTGSVTGAAGFHSYVPLGSGRRAYYGTTLYGSLSFMTSVLSHEVAEAVTDPDVAAGWYDANGDEIGDLQPYQDDVINGYTLQRIWSNVRSQARTAP